MTPAEIQRCRDNLGSYYLAQHPDYQWVEYQQTFMVPALHRVAEHKIEALLIQMPPRHSKTEIGTIANLSWLFGRYPERKNMLVSYSDKFAERFGKKILRQIQSEVHREVFPDARVSPAARAGHYFVMEKGGEFFSAGFSGTITGAGVNGVLVIDDPVKSMDEAKSSPMMESRIEDYRSSVKPRLENASRLMCLTSWCRGDFVHRVLDEEGTVQEGGLWTVFKLPAEAEEKDPLGREPGKFLWAEHYGTKWYEDHKKDLRTWNALYQQNPEAEKGKFFKRQWLQTYPNPIKPGKFPAYMMTDPAKSPTSKHDRSCTLVFVATSERRLLLVDGVLSRPDPEEHAQDCIRLIKKWRPRKWLYEEYGMVNNTWYLTAAAKKAGVNIYPIPVGRKGPRHMLSKESRIEALIPDFREGRIVLPHYEFSHDSEGEHKPILFPTVQLDDERLVSIVDYFIDEEYVLYAGEDSVAHDDMLDTMSRLHEPELSIIYPMMEMNDLNRELSRNRLKRTMGSWEGRL